MLNIFTTDSNDSDFMHTVVIAYQHISFICETVAIALITFDVIQKGNYSDQEAEMKYLWLITLVIFVFVDAIFYTGLVLSKPFSEYQKGIYETDDNDSDDCCDMTDTKQSMCNGHCYCEDCEKCSKCITGFILMIQLALVFPLFIIAFITAQPTLLFFFKDMANKNKRVLSTVVTVMIISGLISILLIPSISLYGKIISGVILGLYSY